MEIGYLTLGVLKFLYMQIIAYAKQVKMSPRKVRLVADSVRKRSIADALNVLSLLDKRPAGVLRKTLQSAVANAVNNAKLAQDSLVIKMIDVTQGPAMKRFHPSTRGRVHPYKKRTSNIRIVLEDK